MSAIPAWSDFGKSVKDLLKKKFVSNSFDFTSKYASGVTSETALSVDQKGSVQSGVKVAYKCPNFGELEGDFNVNGKLKGTVKLTKLAKNLTLKAVAASKANDEADLASDIAAGKDKFVKNNFTTLSADYNTTVSDTKVVVSTTVKTYDFRSATVDVNGVIGEDGLATGGFVKLAVNKGEANPLLQDAGLGVQYSNADYTIGVTSSNFFSKLSLSQFLNFSKDYQLGSQFDWTIDETASFSTVAIGSSYQVDKSTLLKLKGVVGKDKKGPVFGGSVFVDYALSNQLKVGVSADLSGLSANPFVPTSYGVSVNLGD